VQCSCVPLSCGDGEIFDEQCDPAATPTGCNQGQACSDFCQCVEEPEGTGGMPGAAGMTGEGAAPAGGHEGTIGGGAVPGAGGGDSSSGFAYSCPAADDKSAYGCEANEFEDALVIVGDQLAQVEADVRDGHVIELARSATPIRQTILAGISPRAAEFLEDGTLLLAGRSLVAPAGAWLGRLGTGRVLDFQAVLDAQTVDSVVDLAPQGPSGALLLGFFETDGTVFVTTLDGAGELGAVTRIDTTAFPSRVIAMSDGGFAFVASAFLNPDRVSYVVRVDDAGDIAWQKMFSGGFAEVTGIAETSDGGVVVNGRLGATGATSIGYLALLNSGGSLTWQRTLSVRPSRVLPVTNGLRVIGSNAGGLLVMDLDSDGALTSATSYADTDGASLFGMGGGLLAGGGVGLCGSMMGGYLGLLTGPDLALGECADAALGASASLASITIDVAAATVSDSALTASTLPAFTRSTPTTAATTTTLAATNLCDN
jgi:hypothetical protein